MERQTRFLKKTKTPVNSARVIENTKGIIIAECLKEGDVITVFQANNLVENVTIKLLFTAYWRAMDVLRSEHGWKWI